MTQTKQAQSCLPLSSLVTRSFSLNKAVMTIVVTTAKIIVNPNCHSAKVLPARKRQIIREEPDNSQQGAL